MCALKVKFQSWLEIEDGPILLLSQWQRFLHSLCSSYVGFLREQKLYSSLIKAYKQPKSFWCIFQIGFEKCVLKSLYFKIGWTKQQVHYRVDPLLAPVAHIPWALILLSLKPSSVSHGWLIDTQREEGLEASVLTQHSSSFKNTNVILDFQLIHLVCWSPRAWQPVRVSDYPCLSTMRPQC